MLHRNLSCMTQLHVTVWAEHVGPSPEEPAHLEMVPEPNQNNLVPCQIHWVRSGPQGSHKMKMRLLSLWEQISKADTKARWWPLLHKTPPNNRNKGRHNIVKLPYLLPKTTHSLLTWSLTWNSWRSAILCFSTLIQTWNSWTQIWYSWIQIWNSWIQTWSSWILCFSTWSQIWTQTCRRVTSLSLHWISLCTGQTDTWIRG